MEAVLERKITWREFLEMDFPDDGFIYELINGELMRRSSPNPPHQRALGKLYVRMETFVSEKKLGHVFPAPLDVFMGDLNGIQPDILFISKEREFIIDNQNGIMGAPDLIVEVISPGYVRRDRVEKKEVYEQFAVREYWIIDPDHRTVEILVMQNNAYVLHAFLEKEGKAASTILDGFEIDIQTLFE
jgi:Uma2 family endonuclease